MKFFIYSRKSVFTGKGESIENQIEMCRQYILTKFPDTAERDITIYEDEGFSAKNIQRPQFQQMLKDLRVDKPDYVVCYRLDRVSRSVSDFSLLIEELNRRGISFICMKEEFDTSKPMGKAMMYIASVFAQLERETIAERVRDNMLMLARTGRWLGGTTPTGYTSEKHVELFLDGKRKISCKLKENPEELRVVDKIFDSYLELHSLSGVCNRLTAHGIKTRSGSPYSLPVSRKFCKIPSTAQRMKRHLIFLQPGMQTSALKERVGKAAACWLTTSGITQKSRRRGAPSTSGLWRPGCTGAVFPAGSGCPYNKFWKATGPLSILRHPFTAAIPCCPA